MSKMADPAKVEVRGYWDGDLVEAIDVLAKKRGTDRQAFIQSVVLEFVREELHFASFVTSKLGGNPLMPEAAGV